MRLVNIPSRHLIKLYNGMYETTMKGSIIINYQPSEEYHLVNKKYVDDIVNNIDFSKLETTIDKNVFFNYPGDFEKNSSGDYMLKKSSGLTNGHIVFNVNGKGLSSSSSAKIPPELWGDKLDDTIINKDTLPSTPEGLGIKDVITTDGKGVTNKGFETTDTLTNPKSVVTPRKERDFYNPKVEYETGDIVLVDESTMSAPVDFYKLNNDTISIAENRKLFDLIGYDYSVRLTRSHGTPWKGMGVRNNHSNSTELVFEEVSASFPKLAGFGIIVTKEMIYLLGGYNGDFNNISDDIYMATYKEGVLGDFNKVGKLPSKRVWSKAVVFDNKVFLIGGTDNPLVEVKSLPILRCSLNSNGTLHSTWYEEKNPLLGENLHPIIYISSNRINVVGGMKIGTRTSEEISFLPSYLTHWSSYSPVTGFSNWFMNNNEEYIVGNTDMSSYSLGFFLTGTKLIEGQDSNYRIALYSYITDRLNLLNFRVMPRLQDSFTTRSINTPFNRATIPRDSGGVIFGSGVDKGFVYNNFFRTYPGGGFNTGGDTGYVIDPINREFFEVILLNNKILALGGISGDPRLGYERVEHQKIYAFDFPGNGGDDYMSLYSRIENDPNNFRLPLIDPIIKDNTSYSYFIKR